MDLRLTAEDGYQAERSYPIASPPKDSPNVAITVERLDDGEVSPYLVDEVRVDDHLELRGPIGRYFVWEGLVGRAGLEPATPGLKARLSSIHARIFKDLLNHC